MVRTDLSEPRRPLQNPPGWSGWVGDRTIRTGTKTLPRSPSGERRCREEAEKQPCRFETYMGSGKVVPPGVDACWVCLLGGGGKGLLKKTVPGYSCLFHPTLFPFPFHSRPLTLSDHIYMHVSFFVFVFICLATATLFDRWPAVYDLIMFPCRFRWKPCLHRCLQKAR